MRPDRCRAAPRPALLLAAVLGAGCGGGAPDAGELGADGGTLGPQLALDTALERAARLGEALATPITAVRNGDDPLDVVVERHFGPRVERREVDGWLEVGDGFRYRPGMCDSLATAESRSGRPALVLASPDASLFYEWTVIETDTGRLYQSVGQVSAGCDTGSVDWFGPFEPAAGAAITGAFTDDERSSLGIALADALHAALEGGR